LKGGKPLIQITPVKIGEKSATGLRVELPDSPPLVAIIGEKGFIMCGFLNMEAAERLKVAAATVSGVNTPEDILQAQIKVATSKAQALGIKPGMKGTDALRILL